LHSFSATNTGRKNYNPNEMNRKKVELQIASISSSHAEAGAYALLLEEKEGQRKLPIIIGASEAQAIVMELKGIVPPRPLTHSLFTSVLEMLGVNLLRVLIYKADNGVFYSYIYLRSENTIYRIDARTSDAIVLALRMNAELLIYEDLLQTECLKMPPENGEPDSNHAGPENGRSHSERVKSLQEALQQAVSEEDYERAARLRDQINQYSKPE